MKALLITFFVALMGAPALAQHAGHGMPVPTDGAQHKQESESAPAAGPHAGHGMSTAPEMPQDPHASHKMPPADLASPSTAGDVHAGHDMRTMPPSAPPASPHAGHGLSTRPGSSTPAPEDPPPPAALSGPGHAADVVFDPSAMGEAREQLRVEQGAMTAYRVMVDQAEARIQDGRDGYLWDAQGWYGGDINKLWIKTEGEGSFGEKPEEAEVQVLWSRAITPWFDFQGGLRYDFQPDPERGHLVAGLQGLTPYYIGIDAAAFLSDEGDFSARLEAEYDLLITQRLILQPKAEISLAAQQVRERGIGSGITDVELGLRLRYEFLREFAPYIGVRWERKLFDTADFVRDEGEDVDSLALVAGLRFWF